jgi:hypothetical protein
VADGDECQGQHAGYQTRPAERGKALHSTPHFGPLGTKTNAKGFFKLMVDQSGSPLAVRGLQHSRL